MGPARLVGTVLLCILGLAGWVRAEASLLQQTQAADLMSGLLTYYGDLTNARRDAMRSYLEQIGKLQDYEAHKPAAPPRQDVAFNDAFKGAVLFTQEHPNRLGDGSLLRMSDTELREEFTAIQHYNLAQFVDLNKKRDEIGSMKAYLDQTGQFDAYMRWAEQNLVATGAGAGAGAGGPTSRPTTRTAQGFADWIAEQAGSLKTKAWERAQAKGMSREEFEKQWQQKLVELRLQIDNRVETMRQLAADLQGQPGRRAATGPAARAGLPMPRPSAAQLPPAPTRSAQQQAPQAFTAVPAGAQDPRWQPYYYGPERQFNSWADPFPDVYRPTVNGGVFRSYDQRLNQDYDSRVNGEIDRRENTSGDRRLDFRVDPRVNY